MTTIQVKSEIQIGLDELLTGVSQLETPDLEGFLTEVSILLAHRKVASLPQREAELLQAINKGLLPSSQQRYDELSAKLRAEAITDSEHKELLALIDQSEVFAAERLERLLELAQLRQITLPELMDQLGLQPPPVHV
jgi:hypothetical protein